MFYRSLAHLRQDLFVVVVLDALREGVQQVFLVVLRLVRHWADVSVLNLDVEALGVGQIVELVVDVVRVLHILLKAENCEFFEHLGLVHHRVEAVRVVEDTALRLVWVGSLALRRETLLAAGRLLGEVRRLIDFGLLENLGFDRIWCQLDI